MGGHHYHTYDTVISDVSLQGSAYGLPIPIVYGTNRITGNIIDYMDFTAIPHTSTQRTGKGGGSTSSTSYTYTVAASIGLCEGPIAGIGRAWQSSNQYSINQLWDTRLAGIFTTLGSTYGSIANLDLKRGSYPQSAWSYMTTYHPTHALAYSGTAVISNVWSLGDSAQFPDYSWEILGQYIQSATNPDADPRDIVYDLLTNAVYGVYGPSIIPYLADMTPFSLYCQTKGLYFSPRITDQRSALDVLQDILDATSCQAVWSQGKLKIVPYCETLIVNNGLTFTPNVTPVYDLTNDDFLTNLTSQRTLSADAQNWVEVQFADRSNDYNDNVGRAVDLAAINKNGVIKMPVLNYDFITNVSVAQAVAQLALQRALYIRNIYKTTLPWKYVSQDPMDIETVTEPNMGLVKKAIRITKMDFDENDDQIEIEAEECLMGTTATSSYSGGTAQGVIFNLQAASGSVNAPIIFPIPTELTAGQLMAGIAVSGANPYWGGCNVWISNDELTYSNVGTINTPARMGVLTAPLPLASGLDTSDVLGVDLTESLGSMLSASAIDFSNLVTMCYVGGEFIAYETATLQAQYKYNLTYLQRGCYGSVPALIPSGANFCRMDQAIFQYPFKSTDVGRTVYLKFTSFNIFQTNEESLANVTAYPYMIANPSFVPVSAVNASVSGTQVTFTITPPMSAAYDHCEIYVRTRSLTWNDLPNMQWNQANTSWGAIDESNLANGITYTLVASAQNKVAVTLPSGTYTAKAVAVSSSPSSLRADFAVSPTVQFTV